MCSLFGVDGGIVGGGTGCGVCSAAGGVSGGVTTFAGASMGSLHNQALLPGETAVRHDSL